MVKDYSDLWGEADPKEATKLDAARKAFLERIEKYRLPTFEEVDSKLDTLSTKAKRKNYFQDIVRRYSFYFAESEAKNLEHKTEWEEQHEADGLSFEAIYQEELSRAQRHSKIILNAYNRIKMLFASTDPDFIPSKILWNGDNREKQIPELILA